MPQLDTVFMFSGQGSHYFQMGRALFEQNGVFRASMLRLDGMVRELSGSSVVETVYCENHSKGELFDRILSTHPAIFMVEYSLAQSLTHAGIVPDVTLGASLGSFAAAAVAGIIDVEDALMAVIRQATTIEVRCEPGGMIAIARLLRLSFPMD
jgi:acyl transferase domain-containing protein